MLKYSDLKSLQALEKACSESKRMLFNFFLFRASAFFPQVLMLTCILVMVIWVVPKSTLVNEFGLISGEERIHKFAELIFPLLASRFFFDTFLLSTQGMLKAS